MLPSWDFRCVKFPSLIGLAFNNPCPLANRTQTILKLHPNQEQINGKLFPNYSQSRHKEMRSNPCKQPLSTFQFCQRKKKPRHFLADLLGLRRSFDCSLMGVERQQKKRSLQCLKEQNLCHIIFGDYLSGRTYIFRRRHRRNVYHVQAPLLRILHGIGRPRPLLMTVRDTHRCAIYQKPVPQQIGIPAAPLRCSYGFIVLGQ